MKKHYYIWIFATVIFFSNASKAQVVVDHLLDEALHIPSGTLLRSGLQPWNLEVIVSFHGTGAATPAHLKILNDVGINRGVAFQSFPIVGVLATSSQISLLKRKSMVRSIFLNRQLEYFNENSTELTGVDRLREDPDIIAKNEGVPVTGSGVGVLINDSGVDGTHQDIRFNDHLVQNVLGTTNLVNYLGIFPPVYVENVPSTDSNSGHGTHVTGSVGATGAMSNGKYEGAAPGADLIGYGSGAALFILDALGGLDYAAANQQKYSIRVVNNSWGGSGRFNPNDPINIATKVLYDKGISTVFAAGNAGPSPGTLNPYSLAPWVISVAAGDRNRQLADFSSRGVKNDQTTFTMDGEVWVSENRPTITAPGVDIISTRAISPLPVLSTVKDITNLDPTHLPFYTHMSGTSMAAPHVSGIVALMLEADPTLLPGEIKDILQLTATPMPGYETWEAGAGYVNAYEAVNYVLDAKTTSGNTAAVPATETSLLLSDTANAYSLTGYPNPFRSGTTIRYTLPDDGMVNVMILDKHGNQVATLVNSYQKKGSHELGFQKSNFNLTPGIYIVKISNGEHPKMLRLVVTD